ncbi:ATP-binding cassette sub-family G member 1-like [Panonychus citri]|uniref:ATP-binding cassette sub-family G member 1-like n=1 Tax=Panonychus citri TaxID=50023 RepID=UPI0023072658|nr:ATP-binding cassette sub-family G member 1-like [Panonychus citri]
MRQSSRSLASNVSRGSNGNLTHVPNGMMGSGGGGGVGVNRNNQHHSSNGLHGIDNVCLNIDSYLDDLDQNMDPINVNKGSPTGSSMIRPSVTSNSLPSTSTDYKNWSMVSKSSIRRLSLEQQDIVKEKPTEPSDAFLAFPFEYSSHSTNSIVRLVWRNLTYTSPKAPKKPPTTPTGTSSMGPIIRRVILDKQNGEITGGTLTAIIGPSGAGKSTLLESLAGRRTKGLKGSIMVTYDRDYLETSEESRSIKISFIGQKDQLIGELTVRETLMFASRLKNYKRIRNSYYHPRLVNSVLKALTLEGCAEVRVGRISGGQLKRVTFAIELISGPDILMLDEPTSGLDSSSTYSCISLLRQLTDLRHNGNYYKPPAIICSIHQPSARVLNIFHQMYVLSSDGRCLYQGSPTSLLSHLSRHDLTCPQFHNPADFIIEVASGDYGLEPINKLALYESTKQMTLINDEKTMYLSCRKLIVPGSRSGVDSDTMMVDDQMDPMNNGLGMITVSPNEKRVKVTRIVDKMKQQNFPVFSHFIILLTRTYLTTIRDPKLTWFRIGQAIFIGLLMSYLYDYPIGEADGCFPASVNTGNGGLSLVSNNLTSTELSSLSANLINKSPGAVLAATQDNVAFIFFITLFTVMACMMPTVLTFPAEVAVHIQERNNGWYSCWTYYWTKIIADTPYQIVITTLFCSIVYPMTGQIWDHWRFALFIFISILISNIAQTVGMLFGTIYVRSVQNAVFMAPLSMAPVFLLSGFFGKISKVPLALKPIATISYVRYAFEAFLIVLYGYDRCPPLNLTMANLNSSPSSSSSSSASPSYSLSYAAQDLHFSTELPPTDYEDENISSSPDYPGDPESSTGTSSYLYDSLPKIWSGFYNPLDYLRLAAELPSSSSSPDQVTSSSLILNHFSLKDDYLWQNIAILIASLTLLRLLAYFILMYKTNERR